MMQLERFYRGKRVLITGHTGFKGSWLSFWLIGLGAKVAGYSIDIPTSPSNYEILNLKEEIKHYSGDVRDLPELQAAMNDFRPQIVFHLAAQPIVRISYDQPVQTIQTNAIGTLHLLECIRQVPSIKTGVIITSDKCYQNQEWPWGYRETDRLGGEDPYSASKGCAELIAYTYCRSFFARSGQCVATTRAGNVIGGGDWAADRIVPDCVRSWSRSESVFIRSPDATRPWQHVLEPLSGYLWLALQLASGNPAVVGESFNFGPSDSECQPVRELVDSMASFWQGVSWETIPKADQVDSKPEHSLLKLCCDKAYQHLGWQPALDFKDTVRMTAEWYRAFYQNGGPDMARITRRQISEYCDVAGSRGIEWAAGR